MSFIPPPNFGYIEPDLYRSAVPNEMNFTFLQTLHLKTVIYLSLDAPSVLFQEFLKENNIELKQVSDTEFKGVLQRISEQFVIEALHSILNPKAYPILIMCNLGRHRTGTVIGCLRRLQKWSLSAIFDEFRRFTMSKSSPPHEQFIELFDTELVEIPEDFEQLPFKLLRDPIDQTQQVQQQQQQKGPPKPPAPVKKPLFVFQSMPKKSHSGSTHF